MDKEKRPQSLGDVVGWVTGRKEAIDGTPITYFVLSKDMHAGETLRWDHADLSITFENLATKA